MAMGMDSKAAFTAAVEALELKPFVPKLDKLGITTYSDLAFCTPAGSGEKDSAAFEQVIAKLTGEGEDWAYPRFRRLYHQAYAQATRDLEDRSSADPAAKVHMHPSDRVERIEALRKRITGFSLTQENLPSNILIDRFATMMAKSVVRYIKWEVCIDRAYEMFEEPEIKSLRVVDGNLLMQDMQKDKLISISGELTWDAALRRRSAAADISGLCRFEAMDSWSNIMRQHLLQPPPAGYRPVSWAQLRAADEQLFHYVSTKCERGVKAPLGKNETDFEVAWKEGCFDYSVRQLLAFTQGSASAGSSSSSTAMAISSGGKGGPPLSQQDKAMKALTNRLKQAEDQLKAHKKRFENDGPYSRGGGGKGKKGDDKKGRQQGGEAPSRPPAAHEGFQ